MNNRNLCLAIIFALAGKTACAIEVIEPQELQTTSINITDPDQHIKTLGQVSFQIDLSAAHDDLLALKVRRSSLTLKDGRRFTAFGVHKKSGIIVLGGGEISHISIASVDSVLGKRETSVLFYGKGNKVISPRPEDVAVFDTDFNALSYSYTPLQPPGSLVIPITIALDTSGSMAGHMHSVIPATQEFMRELPEFSRCRLLIFNDDVAHLTPRDKGKLTSCPASASILNLPLQAGGATALFKAIDTGFSNDTSRSNKGFPNITIVITDGINTVDFGETLSSLKTRKTKSNSKLFVFWAGNYQRNHLRGLADIEFVSTKNLDNELNKFFTSLGVSLSGLQVLRIGK